MPFSYDDDQRAFISSVSDALRHHSPMSALRAATLGDQAHWKTVWQQVIEMDLLAMLVPEEAGGLELSPTELIAVLEAAGRFAPPVPLTMTAGAFVPLVVRAGAEGDLAAPLLRDVIAGKPATVAIDCSGAGWALLEDRSLTVHCDGIPEAGRAERIAIPAARADGTRVLVVAECRDLDLVSESSLDAASPVGNLHLENADIGDAVVLEGDPTPALSVVWTAAAAELVGVAAELVDRGVAYARDRTQFGQPIGAFQAVKHMLVDAHLAVERARSLTMYAAVLAAEDDPGARRGAHLAKAAASEAADHAGRTAVQVHGGSGITEEEDVSLLYLRARQQSQLLGGSDFHYAAAATTLSVAA